MISTPALSSASVVTAKLCFPEPAHNAAYITRSFKSGTKEYELEARVLYNQAHEQPWVISVHGARSDYSKANALSFGLQERGISLLGVTMSGHSAASPLQPEETKLGNNIREVEAFFDDLDPKRPAVVMGFSLGGTPALKLLEKHGDRIDKLVLFYPGVYAKDTYDKPYGEPFRSAIARPYSYRDNDTIELLRRFPGKLLLVKGEYDGLDPVLYDKPAGGSAGNITIAGHNYYSPIPAEVIDMVRAAVPTGRQSYIEVPGCDHSVILWMREHAQEGVVLCDKVAAFISS